MGDPRSAALFASLRAGLPHEELQSIVCLADPALRQRVAAALAGGTEILEVAPPDFEGMRLDAFDLVIADRDPPATGEPGSDIVRVVEPNPTPRPAFIREAAVLPLPLPQSDALLRAHLRWLGSCRQARVRAARGTELLARHANELEEVAPALKRALVEIEEAERTPVTIMFMGEPPAPARSSAFSIAPAAPDVVVLSVTAGDHIEARLREVRTQASGAAAIVVDADPSPERFAAALYGGARASLVAAELGDLDAVIARVGARRKAEMAGRKWVEALARFGVAGEGGTRGEPSPSGDVDARLISEVAASSAPFVPSGHEVLVVDDEPVVVTVLREALRRGGYRVTTAASAEEAIELLGKQAFDLVLTDKNLPGKSGLDVLRVARKLVPPPAVVLITGYSSYDSAVEAFDVGALDYIEKPIKDLENLRQRVRRALSRRDEQMSQAARPEATPPAADAPRVLLVEVEGSRRQLMAEFLGRTYRVTTVADGDQALARLEAERFDVVLADRNLPGLSGLRVIEQARRLLPHCAAVLYTAYPSYETVKEAFDLGVDAFCVRPSDDLKALADKLAGALRGRGGILLG